MSDLGAEIRQWLAYAADDLAYGELGRGSLPRAASWSFQQAAEKALKAVWLMHRKRIPKTHDLAYLLSELAEYYTLPEPLTAAVLLLSEVTPAVRYPADDLPPVDLQLAKEYGVSSRTIVTWAQDIFQQWINMSESP